MVISPMHTDQLSVIESLAKSLPADMILVVKEHLPMLGCRKLEFYRRIMEMPRVVLVNPFLSGTHIVKNASLVAVITGTAAWEAIRLQIPALVIGNSPYLCIKNGAHYESNLSNLRQAIKKCLQTPVNNAFHIELYLAALLSESFDLPQEILWGDYETCPQKIRNNVISDIIFFMRKRLINL